VCSSWRLIRRIGPMMVTDPCQFTRRKQLAGRPWCVLLLVATLSAAWMSAQADGAASAAAAPGMRPVPPVGVVDARHAGAAAQLYFSRSVPMRRLSYFRLSDPTATAAQCCLSPKGRPVSDPGVPSLAAGAQQATVRMAAVLSQGMEVGFIGLAFDGAGAVAQRLSVHQVRVEWARKKLALDVFHCVSSEGMHVRVAESSTGGELAHYYVPLGADVDADCTPDLMPGR
jgi:hypothetical protein